ncbi:MAG: acetolactate synthase small subunit [Gemmatimonadota bacterium]|jgi:acetolactate synthase-1/3 small subunit
MRHIISILLENQAGALARVASLFSTRGYNIESLNVAPTDDETVSRLTLVTLGSDEVIAQISKQLGKLVDVVSIVDMTGKDHIERELALFKVRPPESARPKLTALLDDFGGHVLGYDEGHGTLELVGNGPEIDDFMDEVADLAEIETVVRSGAMAMERGSPVLDAHFED